MKSMHGIFPLPICGREGDVSVRHLVRSQPKLYYFGMVWYCWIRETIEYNHIAARVHMLFLFYRLLEDQRTSGLNCPLPRKCDSPEKIRYFSSESAQRADFRIRIWQRNKDKLLVLPIFGGLVLGCIEADFASKTSFSSIYQALQDLSTSAPLHIQTI